MQADFLEQHMICGSIFTFHRNQIFTKYRVITQYCLLFTKKLAKSLRSHPGKPHRFVWGGLLLPMTMLSFSLWCYLQRFCNTQCRRARFQDSCFGFPVPKWWLVRDNYFKSDFLTHYSSPKITSCIVFSMIDFSSHEII